MAPLSSTRYHSRNARWYLGATTTAAASPVAFISAFDIDSSTDKADVTAFGDTNKQKVVGLPDDTGSYSGAADIAGSTLYTAARDGLSRKSYFYPDTVNAPGAYFFGLMFVDQKAAWAVAAGAAVSGTWSAASDIIQVLPA